MNNISQSIKYPTISTINDKQYLKLKDIRNYLQYSSQNLKVLTCNLSEWENKYCTITSQNTKLISLHNAIVLMKRVVKKNSRINVIQLAKRLLNYWNSIIDIDSIDMMINEDLYKDDYSNISSDINNTNDSSNMTTSQSLSITECDRFIDKILEEARYNPTLRLTLKLQLLEAQFPNIVIFKELKKEIHPNIKDGLVEKLTYWYELEQIQSLLFHIYREHIEISELEDALISLNFIKRQPNGELILTEEGKYHATIYLDKEKEKFITAWRHKTIPLIFEEIKKNDGKDIVYLSFGKLLHYT